MKKKILFLSPLPPPYYGAAIASDTCLNILISSKEFEVRNIKLNYSKSMVDIGRLNLSKIFGFFNVRRQIKKALNDFRPDLVHFAPATSGLGLIRDYLFIKQIKKYNLSMIFHIHSRMFDSKYNNFFYKRMFMGNKAIVLGEQLISDIEKFVPKRDILILPNATKNEISDRDFNKIMKMRMSSNQFNILFLSNMDESKGWLKLLEACNILKEKELKFHCNFVGDWTSKDQEKKFNYFVKLNNLADYISYLGKKIGEDKKKIIIDSNVLVFPTEYKLETFGLVIIESMMYGIPVIANSIATIPSIVSDKKTGFLLKENSPEEISKCLASLINNKGLRKKMGISGRKKFLNCYEMKNYKIKFLKYLNSI